MLQNQQIQHYHWGLERIFRKKKNTILSLQYILGLGPLHTGALRARESVTITLQALSLVENAEPVQVRFFTLRSRDQRSVNGAYVNADGCEVYVDTYVK